MSGHKRTSAAQNPAFLARALGLAAIVAVAGCSADVTRFNLFGSDFLGSAGAPPAASQVAYAPASPGPGRPSGTTWGGSGVQETTLPPLPPPPQDYRVVGRDYPSASPSQLPPRPEPVARADRPLWTDGDPAPWTDRDPLPWADPATRHKPAPSLGQSMGQSSAWQGRHTMQSGESLYAVARRHKVSVEELKRVNGITDSTKAWAGKVLVVPEGPGAVANPAPAPAGPPRVVQVTPRIVGPEPRPAPEAAQKMAKRDGVVSDAGPAVAGGKFRWPARGKIIAGFGSQPDGSKNEGINLAVPLGTEIHAAEAGRVHYVGDGLKGYGNLILIRHANDWVTAYAHADQVLVKANDEVRRGQVIGKAGKTGPVAQPQLRFELRKGSVPVDPVPHLAN